MSIKQVSSSVPSSTDRQKGLRQEGRQKKWWAAKQKELREEEEKGRKRREEEEGGVMSLLYPQDHVRSKEG